jgi:hypothetical protein
MNCSLSNMVRLYEASSCSSRRNSEMFGRESHAVISMRLEIVAEVSFEMGSGAVGA